jgi:transposase
MTPETLRSWIRQQQVDDGQRDGVSSEAAAEIRALRRRNAELEQTIEILKAASNSSPPTMSPGTTSSASCTASATSHPPKPKPSTIPNT